MPSAADLLRRLAAREPVEQAVALVAAHPDDETIGAGAVLSLFRRLLLVHVTDGAPRNGADAAAHGFTDIPSYAAARHAELASALRVAGVAPARAGLGAPDQGASSRLPALARALRALLVQHDIEVVLTHPYEGGHPDHDATAFITSHAAADLTRLEFASYHAGADGLTTGRFLAAPSAALAGEGRSALQCHEVAVTLTLAEQARKRAMLDCFISQRATLTPFGILSERFRPAPSYDFTQPPHAGPLHYERYDWGMTGPRWRSLAARAMC